MRATKKNLVIAEGESKTQVEWATTPILDAPLNLPLVLTISRENLALGRANVRVCAIAQSCKQRDYTYFAIGVDVAHIGAYMEGKPVRLRYRSGSLPRKFDAAVAQLHETGVFDVRHLETENYTLKPPTPQQSLDYKKTQSKERITREGVTKRRYVSGSISANPASSILDIRFQVVQFPSPSHT